MTWQNRLALNWMLADKGGVCVLFGDQCCTYIPNNTAPEGTFTKAMAKLKELQIEMATNAGRDEKTWNWSDLKLRSWGAWLAKLGILLGVTIGIGGLLFCCVLPLLKSLVIKATVKQMDMLRYCNDEKGIRLNMNIMGTCFTELHCNYIWQMRFQLLLTMNKTNLSVIYILLYVFYVNIEMICILF
ncbi:Syncytin-B [Labeo rohita]|uniref:Syncytin-B n=1 Tax=Labeo rohita TaxID=84645 RepID=A0ABQ8L4L6_LABRO|nr:Syncytin-B [Labeo rohita]